jgi:ribosomal protein L11 methylase PrmA
MAEGDIPVPATLVVSGLLERERERVATAFAAAGLSVEREVVDGEWAALLLRG